LRHLPSARPCPRSAIARRNRPRALLCSPASATRAAKPHPRCSRSMAAAWPWHGRRASPPSAPGPVPQTLGPPPLRTHRSPPQNPSRPSPCSFPPPPHPRVRERRRRRRSARGGGHRRHAGASPSRRPDRLHQRCGSSCMATTRRLRPATAPALSPSAPPVRIAAAVPLFSPCCRREPCAAEEPSVGNPRIPFPPAAVPSVFAGVQRAALHPATAVALPPPPSCHGPGMPVPRARHGHAAALGSQAPRACVRTHTARPRPRPPTPRPASPRPRRAQSLPRRGRDVAFASRPCRWGLSPSTPPGAHTRTRPRAHTHTRTLVRHTGSEPRRTRSRRG
jgi:hypothetical protein